MFPYLPDYGYIEMPKIPRINIEEMKVEELKVEEFKDSFDELIEGCNWSANFSNPNSEYFSPLKKHMMN